MSSSSSSVRSSYSADFRIEIAIKEYREERAREEAAILQSRAIAFEEISGDLFSEKGLHFDYFTHRKIKFRFIPSEVKEFVTKRTEFYCKLVYKNRYKRWFLHRSFVALDIVKAVNKLFVDRVEDDNLIKTIQNVYKIMVNWTKRSEKYNLERNKRILNGEISAWDITFEDMELFFTKEERNSFRENRNKVLKRLLPPEKREFFDEIVTPLYLYEPDEKFCRLK